MPKRLFLLLALALAAACGGGGAASAPPTGPEEPGGPALPPVASLAVSPPAGTVEVNGTFQLTALPRDAQGNVLAHPGLPAATFASSDPARATVDGSGLVTGLAPGPVTVTATLAAGGTAHTAAAELQVVQPAPPAPTLGSLVLDPASGSVPVGGTLRLTATALDASGVPLPGAPAASFQSGNGAAATVDAQGVVRGVAPGSATITASVTVGAVTRTATSAVTVTQGGGGSNAPATALVQGVDDAFSPSTVTIAQGGTVTWTMVDEEHDVVWSGAAPPGGNIPRIDRGASVSRTFPTAGTYGYRCNRHDGKHGGSVVVQAGGGEAQPPVLATLSLTPAAPTLAVGGTVQLTATPRDQYGNAMSGLPAPTFTSSDGTRATVSATGLVTAVAAGTATITARVTAGGVTRTATATVTVGSSGGGGGGGTGPSSATVTTPGNSFSPATVTIQAGGSVTWQFSGDRHNVTFTGAAPTGGNIPDVSSGSVSRTFPATGVYDYLCTRHSGMSGRVVVQ